MKAAMWTAVLCLLATACGGDGTGPVDPQLPPPGECTPALPALGGAPTLSPPLRSAPLALPVLGRGAVTERWTSELWVHGAHAYTGTWGVRGGNRGNVLLTWNVEGNEPRRVAAVEVSGAGTLGDVQVTDDGRYLVAATEPGPGSIVIFSLEDPAAPRQIARFASDATANGVHTAEVARVNGRLYAFLSVNPSPPRLVVVDLTDPSQPQQVLSAVMGTPFIHDVYVRDGLLFTALWNGGTTVWDIGGAGCGSPSNPVELVNFPTVGGKVHNLWWYHDPVTGVRRYVFVGEEGPGSIGGSSSGDIHVVDLGGWSAPREVAFYNVPGAGTHNFSVDEASGILYVAYYNGGVRALDVRGDLGTCSAEQRAPDGRCDLGRMGREVGQGVQWVGDHVYASDMLNGLWKLDVRTLRR
jgi:hypothetical protein